MRSTTVGGSTHSWVVESILREQEEEVELEKEMRHFAKLGNALQGREIVHTSRQSITFNTVHTLCIF
jgi:hypothetical protein